MGKRELTMNPVQEWGEEYEDGAVYGVTLRRDPVPSSPSLAESSPCCAFVQYRTCKVRRLKAATLDILVNHLLDYGCQEQDYGRIFLSTYRTFSGTSELIEMLFHRDDTSSELNNSEFYKSPLLVFVQTWLDDYSEDFRGPPFHAPLRLLLDHLRISSAVHNSIHCQPNFCSLAGQAEALLKKFENEEAEQTISPGHADITHEEEASGDEDSGCDNSLDQCGIMDFSAGAIAEQLTSMDSALFIKVVPYQCLGSMWSQRDKKENISPTIRATIAQFNAITNHVIISLLCWPTDATVSSPSSHETPTTPAQRARIIEKWIRVAQDCRRLKNFSSLKAILSALQSNAVYRLRKTWAAVGRDSLAAFDILLETFPDENYVLTNRELHVEHTSTGVVPYLGTYLTILTMLDTALPDIVEGGLINFEKKRREFEILSQIHVLQASCSHYNLPNHSKIAAWLQGHKLLTDQESYELSKQLEPPVDSCFPTQWSHRTLTKKLSSLLTVNDGSKKVPADQISVSSSGSSASELEDLSSPNSACSIRLQTFHSSCNSVSETFSSTLSCSSSSFSSHISSMASFSDSPTPSTFSSDYKTDHCCPATSCGGAQQKPASSSYHKCSVSMTSLPVYNRQVSDSCIVRVSMDQGHNNGNMYRSIMLTSQDKTAQVIQRALEKHHLEHMNWCDFTLSQVIMQDKELLIPDKANVFYAMSTAANFDFVLRQLHKCQGKPLRATTTLGRYSK